ncbi:MAG TPA: RcnB family protein [Caulobacterales bacterium]|nr:RcnB family protein [Caulobacterales bacterium]
MKRLLVAAAAALTLIGPITVTPAFAQDGYARADNRGDGRDARDARNDRRDDRRDERSRWDSRRDNGYTYNNRWYYGAPPAAYYGRPGFQPGYRAWRRGDRLPPNYRYEVVDYRTYHYAPPPRGYHYVRDDRGDVILAAIATGIIASVILNH